MTPSAAKEMDRKGSCYRLTFDERAGYLKAHVVGRAVDYAESQELLASVASELHRRGMDRVLIYRDIPNVPSQTDLYFIIHALLGQLVGSKIAVVNPHPANRDGLEFMSRLAKKQGVNYRIFDDEAEAERWLSLPDSYDQNFW